MPPDDATVVVLAALGVGDNFVVVDDVVRDIDTIVKQVSYSGWAENQSGDRTVRKELRSVLSKYSLPLTGDLFDHAYAYVRENY